MAQDQEGKTVVHNLMNNEPNETTFKCLKTIFNQKPDLVHIPDNVGDTPLHYVLKGTHNNVNHIDLLLEHGADPLQPDSNGNTALHFFARNPLTFKSRIEQFQGLGVDINARNKKGDPPLFEYITHGQLSWVLCQNKEHENLDNVHHLRYFKEAGADFFARNHAGSSLLHVLAGRKLGGRIFGHNEKQYELPIENLVNWFKFLVGMNLDPMLEDARQRTCLDVAAACGNEHILKLFQQTPEHEALNRSD
ncbi:ankyrin repeat-containing protein [Penicillium odoratum]|uniref:ankyrin repeat-containing protein n=1 Tax=Penicillium odoratum TaxID=1167516 RepID=UPI0025466B6B|nr:ankyrin repeat-containing protein [Penicillium odoratum]KAJ5771941.1 ankyrin repeat-containing protein [Penicillium odoratum]